MVFWDSDSSRDALKTFGKSCIFSNRAPGRNRSMQKGMNSGPGDPDDVDCETVENLAFLQAQAWDRRNKRKRTGW